MSADAYGVPDDFSGPTPDEFYRLVGCVVLVATLLEQKVLELVWSLEQVHTQDHHAGKAGAVLIKEARTALVRMPSLEAEGNDLLDRTDEALNHGHEIVHSLWPDASTDRAWGWRPVTARTGQTGSSASITTPCHCRRSS